MAVKRTTEKADRDRAAADAQPAGPVSTSQEVDVRDLPRNEAPRQTSGPDADRRAGEIAAQDRVPSADDHDLEATLLHRSTGQVRVGEDEPTPVRGPSASASTGRAVTERETVADDAADADGTDRNPAVTRDDPDAT